MRKPAVKRLRFHNPVYRKTTDDDGPDNGRGFTIAQEQLFYNPTREYNHPDPTLSMTEAVRIVNVFTSRVFKNFHVNSLGDIYIANEFERVNIFKNIKCQQYFLCVSWPNVYKVVHSIAIDIHISITLHIFAFLYSSHYYVRLRFTLYHYYHVRCMIKHYSASLCTTMYE